MKYAVMFLSKDDFKIIREEVFIDARSAWKRFYTEARKSEYVTLLRGDKIVGRTASAKQKIIWTISNTEKHNNITFDYDRIANYRNNLCYRKFGVYPSKKSIIIFKWVNRTF